MNSYVMIIIIGVLQFSFTYIFVRFTSSIGSFDLLTDVMKSVHCKNQTLKLSLLIIIFRFCKRNNVEDRSFVLFSTWWHFSQIRIFGCLGTLQSWIRIASCIINHIWFPGKNQVSRADGNGAIRKNIKRSHKDNVAVTDNWRNPHCVISGI